MEFSWAPSQEAFRARVRDFIKSHLPDDWDQVAHDGPASSNVTALSFSFCRSLAEAGLLVPHWPVEYGGGGADAWQHFIVGEEMWAAGEPRGGQYMNVNWIGPTLMRFGTAQQRAEFIPRMARGSVLWCQGFSEPGAGSDLACLRTSASACESGYRINGQKIWTSYAGEAEFCFLLARTGGARKSGLAIFLVPMKASGISVREIPSLVGRGDIHEVFFDDVVVPESCRLGAEGAAWSIVTYALANERVGIPRYAFGERVLNRAVDLLRAAGSFGAAQRRAAQALVACQAARLLSYRVIDERARGIAPSANSSVARLAVVAAERAVSEFISEFVPEGLLGSDKVLETHHQRAITASIAAGAAEIQLNLVASQLLALPR